MKRRWSDLLKVGALSASLVLLMGFPMAPKVEYLPPGDLGTEIPGSSPAICLGINAEQSAPGYASGTCPANHALYGVDDPAGVSGPAERIATRMHCCPLPSKDILLDEHAFTKDRCEDDSVATGWQHRTVAGVDVYEMRCSKVNTERYQLGDARPAAYWGTGAAGWSGAKRITWDNIPAAIRYSNGRQKLDQWDVDGCIGYPFGSLLAEKQSKHCSGMLFKQLQFRGVDGDPAAGTVVKMFPDCDEINGIDSADAATCVKRSS